MTQQVSQEFPVQDLEEDRNSERLSLAFRATFDLYSFSDPGWAAKRFSSLFVSLARIEGQILELRAYHRWEPWKYFHLNTGEYCKYFPVNTGELELNILHTDCIRPWVIWSLKSELRETQITSVFRCLEEAKKKIFPRRKYLHPRFQIIPTNNVSNIIFNTELKITRHARKQVNMNKNLKNQQIIETPEGALYTAVIKCSL